MGPLAAIPLVGRALEGILGGVGGIIGRVWGSKEARDAAIALETRGAQEAQAAEFGYRENRTLWDSLVDGLNRLPRPLFAFGAMWVLVWPIMDPATFTLAMASYALIPEWVVWVLLQVIGLYFGTRMIEKVTHTRGRSAKEIAAVRSEIGEIARLWDRPAPGAQAAGYLPPPTPSETTNDFKDESKPLSNAAIIAWNNQRQKRKMP